MSKALLGELLSGETGKSARLYYDSEFNEFSVKFYRKGVYQKDADYHTDDRTDAFDTAHHFITNQD